MNATSRMIHLYRSTVVTEGYSLFKLGLMYEVGEEVKRVSIRKAKRYYEKAIKHESWDAQYRLSCILLSTGKRRDRKRAIKLLREAAVNGNAPAQMLYFDLTYQRVNDKYENDKCLEFLCKAVIESFAPALYRKAMMDTFGMTAFIPQPKLSCLFEYEYLAGRVYPETVYKRPESCLFVKKYEKYMNSIILKFTLLWDKFATTNKESLKTGFDLFKEAADNYYAPAQYAMGTFYEYGRQVEKSIVTAVDYYKKAAEQGCVPAMIKMARMCEFGQGTKKSLANAMEWYRKCGKFFGAKKEYRRLKWKKFFNKDLFI